MLFYFQILEIFSRVMKITKQYESPSRFWLGPKLAVFVSKPEDIQVNLLLHACGMVSQLKFCGTQNAQEIN